MRKRILLILLSLVATGSQAADWFSNNKLEREQLTEIAQRLENAERRIESQQQRIDLLGKGGVAVVGFAAVLLIGMALGSKTKKDGTGQ